MENMEKKPGKLKGDGYRYDSFANGQGIPGKRKNHLPAMGWNSWNAFGSGNTAQLTRQMAEAMVSLGLDQLGYQYVVLDDGCYRSERVDGCLANEPIKFPEGFRALADEIHAKGLKFGMYNDIGTNLCAGAAVGTCGHEAVDAASYLEWGVDFLKVDNCYYLWDNATFSEADRVRFVYAPNICRIRLVKDDWQQTLSAVTDGVLTGRGGSLCETYVTGIGTFDGTGPENTPVGEQSCELEFSVNVPEAGSYALFVTYATGREPGTGCWLQVAVGGKGQSILCFDDLLAETAAPDQFCESAAIPVNLEQGENKIRLMNHRRQENTLASYATLMEQLIMQASERDVILSICEWGKTQPQNWGYKVGDSWRILNDITFRVGADGDPGVGSWTDSYTASVTSQYNKAVIMDTFAGLDKGWNDPDMLMVGMNGLSDAMCRTHFAMWCMMNAPLMLGLDLRRVTKGDALWQIIANRDLIALNQDALGVQAKRIFCSLALEHPDTTYVTDNDRVDIMAKPLADGSVAISFLNLSETQKGAYQIDAKQIVAGIGNQMINATEFLQASAYQICDLWSKETWTQTEGSFVAAGLEPCGNMTLRIFPMGAQR